MNVEIFIPKLIHQRAKSAQGFMQEMINRLAFGQARYGDPKKEQKYMTRMIMEVKAYNKTGNREQLLNIANYCWLESQAPENKKFHHDPFIDSVTRGKI